MSSAVSSIAALLLASVCGSCAAAPQDASPADAHTSSEVTSDTADGASAPDRLADDGSAGQVDAARGDGATRGAVEFTVSVAATPPSGSVPLAVTVIATVQGDVSIDEVALQWYRGEVRLEGKTQPAWSIILTETTILRVEATHTAPDGATTTRESSVEVEVTP